MSSLIRLCTIRKQVKKHSHTRTWCGSTQLEQTKPKSIKGGRLGKKYEYRRVHSEVNRYAVTPGYGPSIHAKALTSIYHLFFTMSQRRTLIIAVVAIIRCHLPVMAVSYPATVHTLSLHTRYLSSYLSRRLKTAQHATTNNQPYQSM